MAIADFPSLIMFAAVSTATPGGATMLAAASGANFGVHRSVPLMAGIVVALATMAGSAAVGLGSVLQALPALQWAMKIAGSAYLIFLALKIGFSAQPDPSSNLSMPMGFFGGFWLLWQNPKAWAMALGAAASFASLSNCPFRLAIILATVFAAASMVSLISWCALGQMLATLLRTGRHWRILNGALGILLALSILQIWF